MKLYLTLALTLATTLLQAQNVNENRTKTIEYQQYLKTTTKTHPSTYKSTEIKKIDTSRLSRQTNSNDRRHTRSSNLTTREMNELFSKETEFYLSYRNALKLKRLSWLPICCGAAITGTVLGFSHRLAAEPILAGCLIGTACMGTGIWVNIANQKKINTMLKNHNAKHSSNYELGFVVNPGSVGLGVAF